MGWGSYLEGVGGGHFEKVGGWWGSSEAGGGGGVMSTRRGGGSFLAGGGGAQSVHLHLPGAVGVVCLKDLLCWKTGRFGWPAFSSSKKTHRGEWRRVKRKKDPGPTRPPVKAIILA